MGTRPKWKDQLREERNPLEFYDMYYNGIGRALLNQRDPALYRYLARSNIFCYAVAVVYLEEGVDKAKEFIEDLGIDGVNRLSKISLLSFLIPDFDRVAYDRAMSNLAKRMVKKVESLAVIANGG